MSVRYVSIAAAAGRRTAAAKCFEQEPYHQRPKRDHPPEVTHPARLLAKANARYWGGSRLSAPGSRSLIQNGCKWLADVHHWCYLRDMFDRYEPASDFLKAVVAEEAPLSGSPFADANMQQLIAMTRDPDVSNRDWATTLLAMEDADTPEIREALLSAAADKNDIVRAEALVGIARRDRVTALPLVLKALSGDRGSLPVFEAAALVADPALVEALRAWIEPSGNEWLDRYARDALQACKNGRDAAQT